jgi:LemA protein
MSILSWSTRNATTLFPFQRQETPTMRNSIPLEGNVKIALVVLLVLVVIFIIWQYNRLIGLKNRVDNGWAQIDVQLQRRYDLIPNLVETVKGYASHEAGTLQAVTEARNMAQSAAGPAQQGQAENMLTGALKSLFAVSEAYPDLKANQNFLSLQEELSATEGRIAYARQFYNEAVLTFNTAIAQIPGNFFAGPMKLSEREYFEIEPGGEARNNVKVQF